MKKQKFKFSHLYKSNTAKRQSFKITIIYFILGCLWVVVTDLMADRLILMQHINIVILSIAKGLIYVAVTSVLIYVLIYSAMAKLKISERKLHENQRIFKTVFEQAPIGIAIVNDYNFLSEMNTEFEKIMQRSKEELSSVRWTDITHPEDLDKDLELFRQFKEGIIGEYSMEKRFINPQGQYIWIYMVISNINADVNKSKIQNHLCIIQDISERKAAEQSLFESERSKSVLLSNLLGIAYRCKIEDGRLVTEFLSEGCYELTGYKSEELISGASLSYGNLITERYKKFTENEWRSAVANEVPYKYEYEILSASGEEKWVLEVGQGIYDENGCANAIEGIIVDITENKNKIAQIEFLNIHDHLTKLHNRKYYESQKLYYDFYEYLPISIIIADINGVKLINEAFGHDEGDRVIIETAKILEQCCKEDYILARTGGDEFSILMPNTSAKEADELVKYIKEKCEKYNKKSSNSEEYINISIGFATKSNKDESLDKIEKEANEYLLKQKMFESKSHHNAVLSSIMATMYARNQETEAHALRIAGICKKIGERLFLSKQQMDELHLCSILHDMGKVSIDDRILNKQTRLTEREWSIMRMHPEIGYRIAKSVPEIESIAEYIYAHHERLDGTGYPRALKGEEIPLLSRILAVADAYDAMTEGRIYRKAITNAEAVEEIKKNAGKQFDPEIVRIFIEII